MKGFLFLEAVWCSKQGRAFRINRLGQNRSALLDNEGVQSSLNIGGNQGLDADGESDVLCVKEQGNRYILGALLVAP